MKNAANTEEKAQRVITGKCLIATDVDQTILAQRLNREEEKLVFFRRMAPQLVEAARLGAQVGFITGNSMQELCSRFLLPLVEQLCHTGDLEVIPQFHFFCNSGGVYFHFPTGTVGQFLDQRKRGPGRRPGREAWRAFVCARSERLQVQPQYVDATYIHHCLIPEADLAVIQGVLDGAASDYFVALQRDLRVHDRQYDLSWIRDASGTPKKPEVERRSAIYRNGRITRSATVQVTLKPVLSFRQARPRFFSKLVGHDVRSRVVQCIQNELDQAGLGHYVARPGGRASIDVTLGRLDKAYALEFLIDHLRLQGSTHRGQQFGSNTIYFGDEVMVGGGNDYPVTRVPGVLVFAVNRERELVPFLRDVLVPSAIFEGVEATADVLTQFNHCARRLLQEYRRGQQVKTAIEALKEDLFSSRIAERITWLRTHGIPVDDWQTLHTFVSLLARDQMLGRQWLGVLVKELDAIMAQIATSPSTSGGSSCKFSVANP